jgi:hypothetical protein
VRQSSTCCTRRPWRCRVALVNTSTTEQRQQTPKLSRSIRLGSGCNPRVTTAFPARIFAASSSSRHYPDLHRISLRCLPCNSKFVREVVPQEGLEPPTYALRSKQLYVRGVFNIPQINLFCARRRSEAGVQEQQKGHSSAMRSNIQATTLRGICNQSVAGSSRRLAALTYTRIKLALATKADHELSLLHRADRRKSQTIAAKRDFSDATGTPRPLATCILPVCTRQSWPRRAYWYNSRRANSTSALIPALKCRWRG